MDTRDKRSSLLCTFEITNVKRFTTLGPKACTIKQFTAGAYPSEAPFRCSTLGQAPGLTDKHYTRLERLAKDKHSSLLRKSVNYGHKKFYSTDPSLAGDIFFYFFLIFFLIFRSISINKTPVLSLTISPFSTVVPPLTRSETLCQARQRCHDTLPNDTQHDKQRVVGMKS